MTCGVQLTIKYLLVEYRHIEDTRYKLNISVLPPIPRTRSNYQLPNTQ